MAHGAVRQECWGVQKMAAIDRSSKRWLPGRGGVCQNFDHGREERSGQGR